METSFPAILEFISLEISGALTQDLKCAISLTKGLQNYGEIKFRVSQEQNKHIFKQNNTIKFSYTMRLTTRKDFFFHINLIDINTNNSKIDEQIGQFIGISCHMLAETFQNDKSATIQKTDSFAEGVVLKYKIYLPQYGLKDENIIGFKNFQKNDFISNLFSANGVEQQNLLGSKMKKSRADKSMHSKKSMKSSKKSIILDKNQKNMDISSENHQADQQKSKNLKKSQTKQPQKEQFMSRIFKYVRQSGFVDKKKKYEFSLKQTHHNHGLSKKLKAVIILLIMGALLLLADTITDRVWKSKSSKPKQKSTKKSKIDHF